MAETKPRSFLSPSVRRMVCELGFEDVRRFTTEDVITSLGLVDWDALHSCVKYDPAGEDVDFVASVRGLGPVWRAVHRYLTALTRDQCASVYHEWLRWTNCPQEFVNCFQLLDGVEPTGTNLCLLKVTAFLERALGDAYLLVGKECPFLLRDLLASSELASIFGKNKMDVLRVLLGSPQSLNLRNVLWHGFAAPGEVGPMYGSALLLIAASLGFCLGEFLSRQRALTLTHRPSFTLPELSEMLVFPDIDEEELCVMEQLIGSSTFVPEPMEPQWRAAVQAYRHHRFFDCVVLLLPQLEMGLRATFARVNSCPERLLTAESTVLYTTFDEILEDTFNGGNNLLPEELGNPLMDILLDLLSYQEGPRLRDHLSHGEVPVPMVPGPVAAHVLSVALLLLLLGRCCARGHGTLQDNGYVKALLSVMDTYRSVFHPVGRLTLQISECVSSLRMWKDIHGPSEEDLDSEWSNCAEGADSTRSCVMNMLTSAQEPVPCLVTREASGSWLRDGGDGERTSSGDERRGAATRQGQGGSKEHGAEDCPAAPEQQQQQQQRQQQQRPSAQRRFFVSQAQWLVQPEEGHRLLASIQQQHAQLLSFPVPPTRQQPRVALEAVALLRSVARHCLAVSAHTVDGAASRHDQWLRKELRSRQRTNYLRMLKSVPSLSRALWVVTATVVWQLHRLPRLSTCHPRTSQKHIRLLKGVLQCMENLVIYTSPSKNKWAETAELLDKLYTAVHLSLHHLPSQHGASGVGAPQ
ncbi:LOW QUALITY PROTEIN: endoplasmic reticulum membrane-associated RNA degradation protein [Lethenteron reissneri]|uniref:LOW QUALITY PROTEIN: endoplasmic reticulum membrane-associated RNA degradation protein n=1 Tax=Lethenteron reissneri TaxID=7753 RepID=UPI002AB5FC88|nr:LOW QUALITY PROTEIN: endoplasmic reticulum membrane-associated RNA degradation protein [Lethenteron reissneri]